MALSLHDSLAARHRSVRQALASASVDALIVTHLPNIFYLTGFAGTAAIVVVTAVNVSLLTDFRYVASVQSMLESGEGWPEAAMIQVRGSYDEALASFIEERSIAQAGFEAEHLSVGRHKWLAARLRRNESSATGGA